MSIGVIVGKKITILKTALSAFALCCDGPLLGSAVGQLACDRGPKGRENKVTSRHRAFTAGRGVRQHADKGPQGRDNKVKPSGHRRLVLL